MPEAPADGQGTPKASMECQVVLRAHMRVDGGPWTHRLWVTAENVGADALELALPDRCPNGPVDFAGLGAGYDYYGTCNAGACAGTREPRRLTLPAGATQELASVTVHLRGAPPCTKALPAGRHRIVPVVPELGVRTCVVGTVLEVPAPPAPERRTERPTPKPSPDPVRPRERRERPGPAPQTRPTAPGGDAYACTEHADCVLSCPRAAGCCGWPCGCRHAIHRDHKAAFEARYPETCGKPPCPAVACMHDPAFGAACRNGRCVGVSRPGIGF
jgi:hypothetical protein